MKTVPALVFILMLVMSGCASIMSHPLLSSMETSLDKNRVSRTGASVRLCWSPPVISPVVIWSYSLLWRPYGASGWSTLKTAIPPSDTTCATVARSELPANNSDFEFAVKSVSSSGTESELLSSLGEDAYPSPWYLHWSSGSR